MGVSYCSAGHLVSAYESHELDPVQVAEAALDAAEAARSTLNAVSAIDERCLAAARESRARYEKGSARGPLDGIPITVKDSYRCEGLLRWHGSAVHDGEPPAEYDSAPIKRLREAGAVIIGKTAMPDFGMLAAGISSQFGIIRNPWDPSLNPGGSSAGAAVTLAAGVTPVALGTDIAGSVRLPAAHCGLAAIKPTQGLIAYAPASMARSAGLMARSAADLEPLLEVVGRSDASDPWCLPGAFKATAWGSERVRGLRVALLTDMGYGLPLDPAAREAVMAAAAKLASWDAVLEEVRLDLTDADYDALDLGFKLGALAEVDSAPQERRGRLLGVVREWCETARSASGRDAALAAHVVEQARDRVIAALADYDLVLAPVMSVPTFPADQFGPAADVVPLYHTQFTAWSNQTGQPAAGICGGRTAAGMPIGVQIIGKRFQDADVLRAAVLLEQALAVDLPWPGLPQKELSNA